MPERIVLPTVLPTVLPAASSPRVSVIVPATAPDLLLACLRSLAWHGGREVPFEVIAVVNLAEPGLETMLRETVTGLRVAASPANFGLAGAGHRGRAMARGELLVILHDDAEVEPGWLEALVAAADRHPEAGAVGGKVLFPDGRLQSAGMILWREARTSVPWSGKAPPPSAFDRPRAVDYCGTASLLIRAATWDAVGGFDERFFPVYFVDVDLAMAIRRLGQIVLCEPRSVIRHHQGASGNLRFRRFVTERNRRLFLDKWGEALEAHEPWDGGSPALVARALARAEAFRPTPGPLPPRPAYDPAGQERRYLEMDLALQKAYVAFLESGTAAVEPGELAELRARSAALEAIERTRWWRLYGRLSPFLRRLRPR